MTRNKSNGVGINHPPRKADFGVGVRFRSGQIKIDNLGNTDVIDWVSGRRAGGGANCGEWGVFKLPSIAIRAVPHDLERSPRARTLRVTREARFAGGDKVFSPLPASTRRPFSLGVHEDEPADDANLAAWHSALATPADTISRSQCAVVRLLRSEGVERTQRERNRARGTSTRRHTSQAATFVTVLVTHSVTHPWGR